MVQKLKRFIPNIIKYLLIKMKIKYFVEKYFIITSYILKIYIFQVVFFLFLRQRSVALKIERFWGFGPLHGAFIELLFPAFSCFCIAYEVEWSRARISSEGDTRRQQRMGDVWSEGHVAGSPPLAVDICDIRQCPGDSKRCKIERFLCEVNNTFDMAPKKGQKRG